jgi:hypothetical protein
MIVAYEPDNSGEYIPPKSTYLDNVEIYDPELGGIVPAWKALIYHGAKARHFAEMRNDSAGAVAAEAQKGAPSGQPKHAPPLAADSIKAKAKDEATKMQKVMDALDTLETRLGVLEERKRQQAEDAARAEIAEQALLLAEQIAEETPGAVMDALSPPRPKQRLH